MDRVNIIDRGELRHRLNSKNEFFLIVCLDPPVYKEFAQYIQQQGKNIGNPGYSFLQFLEGLGINVKEKKEVAIR
ncbi:MAG: hypothetical protein AMQ22_00019 [Candidatus Methanofastidiosum methylothiophilum]|uniref:Uncharacterized protein n=1 Tax=Candidatus Methanofastidiosum methylothiophilum TaxID=1705564 RepID=A0A150J9E2_9EURY|nr:MAG: hypothetical protein AMQ22_00019 [Candidatus Methanofastidiosum methylthiophilus]